MKVDIPNTFSSKLSVPTCTSKTNAATTTLVKPVLNDTSLQESVDDIVSQGIIPKSQRKEQLEILRKEYRNLPQSGEKDCLSHLSEYFGTSPFCTKRLSNKTIKNNILTYCKPQTKANLEFNSKFSGALIIPACKLLIQTQGCNQALIADHHALAASTLDNSPGYMHAVLSQVQGEELSRFH